MLSIYTYIDNLLALKTCALENIYRTPANQDTASSTVKVPLAGMCYNYKCSCMLTN